MESTDATCPICSRDQKTVSRMRLHLASYHLRKNTDRRRKSYLDAELITRLWPNNSSIRGQKLLFLHFKRINTMYVIVFAPKRDYVIGPGGLPQSSLSIIRTETRIIGRRLSFRCRFEKCRGSLLVSVIASSE